MTNEPQEMKVWGSWPTPAAPNPVPPMVTSVAPDKPVWPTVIGVISIVYGLWGVLNGCGGIFSPFYMQHLGGVIPDDQSKAVFDGLSEHFGLGLAVGLSGLLVGGLLLASGIGLILRRRWSIRAHTIWAVLAILQSGLAGVYGFYIQQTQFQAMKAGGMPPMPIPMEAFAVVGLFIGLVFLCVYPTFVLVWFFRATIRAQMVGWR